MGINTNEKEKAALFDNLIRDTYEAIILIERNTNQGRTIHAADRLWEKTVGGSYDFENTLCTYIKNYCVDSDSSELLESVNLGNIAEKLKRKKKYSLFCTIRNDHGNFLLKEFSFYKNNEDEYLCLIQDITNTFHDVSQHVDRLEDALRMANKEISEKNTFLNLMSRNIRTPLYSIMGLTRIAQDDNNTNSFDSYLRKISMSGTYMNETIDDILELRRISNRKLILNPEPVKLGEFLSRVKQIMKSICDDRHLLFSINTDNVSGLTVLADEHALNQVFTKLMQSAVGYTVRGGRINLNVREMFRHDGISSIVLSVESRGIVIDQERLAALFEPMDKLRDRIEDTIGSLDIALIILKSYLFAMGASAITTEADESRGTKISVTLSFPVVKDTSQTDENVLENRYEFVGLRALIADDNTINREIGERLLLSRGIDVVSAANGQEALDIFIHEKGRFDIVILDILMPVLDGLETTRAIRHLEQD